MIRLQSITKPALLAIVPVAGNISVAPSAHAVHAAASPNSLVVQLSDITQVYGSGFRLALSTVLTKGQMQSGSFAVAGIKSSTSGFKAGYVALYAPKASGSDPVSITSTVAQYGTAAVPQNQVHQMVTHQARVRSLMTKYGYTASVSALPGVGAEALQISYSNKTLQTHAFAVFFSRGPYAATLIIGSRKAIRAADATRLAKMMDARIQHS